MLLVMIRIDVAEVDVAAERVGQPAFLHDLEEHVEDVGVRLLDLVEQDDRSTAGGGCAR